MRDPRFEGQGSSQVLSYCELDHKLQVPSWIWQSWPLIGNVCNKKNNNQKPELASNHFFYTQDSPKASTKKHPKWVWDIHKASLNCDLGVSKNRGTPKWMAYDFMMENPIKMDDFRVPLFLETPINWWWSHLDFHQSPAACHHYHLGVDTYATPDGLKPRIFVTRPVVLPINPWFLEERDVSSPYNSISYMKKTTNCQSSCTNHPPDNLLFDTL